VARELEQAPEQAGRQISKLLREVFYPLEMVRTDIPVSHIRVAVDGATLVVPVPQLPDTGAAGIHRGTIVLRYAHRGRRLFTHDDQLLAERLIEQLRRALTYDRAVEQGRTEERTRIAQDLHDDIGARLLTLMYQAQNPEVEEYIRHTLQDLKTLTRGLAAGNHRLSHAAAEWKADITQRLGVTGCDLHWSFSADSDILLSVVQWSGLTRVLRELVNNIITHARATQVEIAVHFDRGRLLLTVTDDGCGRQPSAWSPGLGLGGVRKRVRLLGGQVLWSEQDERGIRCEVRTALSSEKG
jgi:signal transduction histidine kinase